MKKLLAVFLSFSIGLLLVSVVLAGANSLSLQETSLTPKPLGEAYEINLGSDGFLYVSDYSAKQIWRVDPADLSMKKYQLADYVLDATPDNTGAIWFTDGATTFAHLNQTNDQAIYWDVPDGHNLQGITFDPSGKLWMTEWINLSSKVYSFDISSHELCTYTLPLNGGSQSYYILSEQDNLWIANRGVQRIYRLNSTTDQATSWQIPYSASRPVGLALDGQGNLWWADEGLGALARLDPDPLNPKMTRYNLPNTAQPQMIALHGDVVWYTSYTKPVSNGLGYFGALDSQQASGTTSPVYSETDPVSKQCNPNLGDGKPLFVSVTTDTPSWSPADLTTLLTPSSWHVYQLPANAYPYGIMVANSELWMVDQGRQKLMRIPVSDLISNYFFLPIIVR